MARLLRSIRLHNFKAVADADVKLAPLSMIVGPNSAGKSTLLQALLLQLQAVKSDVRGALYPLNGSVVRLGGFSEVLWNGASEDPKADIALAGELLVREDTSDDEYSALLPSDLASAYRWSMSFGAPGSGNASSMEVTEASISVADTSARGENSLFLWVKEPGSSYDWEDFAEAPALRAEPLSGVMQVEGSVQMLSGPPEPVSAVELAAGLPRRILVQRPLSLVLAVKWAEALSGLVQRSRISQRATMRHEDQLRRQIVDLERRLQDAERTGDSPEATERLRRRIAELRVEVVDADVATEVNERLSPDWRQRLWSWAHADIGRYATDVGLLTRAFESFSSSLRARLDAAQIGQLGRVAEAELYRVAIEAANDALAGVRLDADTEPESSEFIASHVDVVLDFLRDDVRYLGPLRASPQPAHPQVPNPQGGDIGALGENTAAVIHACRNRLVVSPSKEGPPRLLDLPTALHEWMTDLELGGSVETTDMGPLGISLTIEQGSAGRPVDLTAVGVGVSQVLPVLTLCLLSEPGSVVILEQPELHLHPATQQRLADFFLACVRSGRQLIVETHSDHLVSRIRRRIVEDRSGVVKELASIVFAEQKAGEGTSYRQIEVSDFGAVEQWPEGFFDQAATESQAILKEAVARRKEARASDEGAE